MSVLLGLTKTGYRAFRQQNMFTVHYLRKNPSISICRRHVPYQWKFENLPSNALFCEGCLHAPSPHA